MRNSITTIVLLITCLLITGCSKVSLSPIADNLSGWSCYLEDTGSQQQDVWKIEYGVLVCTGSPRGYLYTDDSYSNFTMTLQWRWPEGKPGGKGGVLIDTTGADKIWPKSLEAQINSGAAGDFWALDGYKVTGAAERMNSLSHDQYGELINIVKMKPVENAVGQWNSYTIAADGENVTLTVNGQVVNKAVRTNTSGGKICITSEGSGIEFRNITITRN